MFREAEKAPAEAERDRQHCAEIAEYAKKQGKIIEWSSREASDEAISAAPHMESFECDCGMWHVRRREVAQNAAREPRQTYAERRAAQKAEWNPDTKSYEADVL